MEPDQTDQQYPRFLELAYAAIDGRATKGEIDELNGLLDDAGWQEHYIDLCLKAGLADETLGLLGAINSASNRDQGYFHEWQDFAETAREDHGLISKRLARLDISIDKKISDTNLREVGDVCDRLVKGYELAKGGLNGSVSESDNMANSATVLVSSYNGFEIILQAVARGRSVPLNSPQYSYLFEYLRLHRGKHHGARLLQVPKPTKLDDNSSIKNLLTKRYFKQGLNRKGDLDIIVRHIEKKPDRKQNPTWPASIKLARAYANWAKDGDGLIKEESELGLTLTLETLTDIVWDTINEIFYVLSRSQWDTPEVNKTKEEERPNFKELLTRVQEKAKEKPGSDITSTDVQEMMNKLSELQKRRKKDGN